MSKVFNLYKHAQMDVAPRQVDVAPREDISNMPAGASNDAPPLLMDQAGDASAAGVDMGGQSVGADITMPQFKNGSELFEFLEAFRMKQGDAASAYDSAWNGFFAKRIVGSDQASSFEDGLRRFYEQPDQSNESNKVAMDLFDIYSSMVNANVQPIMAETKSASSGIDSLVDETDNIITKMARNAAQIMSKRSFNLSKTAQQKSLSDSVILTGPSQVSMSPFTRDLQSGLHLVEQNKGFGLRIGDILDVDFEAIWRGNVMDKYYRSTRDSSGMYGGGYIDDKFEVNRHIPVGNDYQLPPGIRHRPYIAESGLLEARMEVARGNKDKLSDPRKFAKIYNNSLGSKKKV